MLTQKLGVSRGELGDGITCRRAVFPVCHARRHLFDADGYLYVHDRVKDLTFSGGENIYPAQIASALAGHEALADIAIIGVPDERWGEQFKAVVVVEAGTTFDESEFDAFCRARLAGYKIPRSVDAVTELLRNPSGKILKRVLKALLWQDHERPVN